MENRWILAIFGLSFGLMATLKGHELRSLTPFFKLEKKVKIAHFAELKSRHSQEEQTLLSIWESILTGRTNQIPAKVREKYKKLALAHIFTPSGFHLSAALFPVLKFLRARQYQIGLYLFIGLLSIFLPGMGAMKRMILVKGSQKALGFKIGFVFALVMDVLFGSFQNSSLSFTYSFLFLGLIYSGKKGIPLIFLLFIGQCLVAYFQSTQVSPLIIIFSPILNLAFSSLMPLLFALALPMWNWQIDLALIALKFLNALVEGASYLVESFPSLEINLMTFVLLFTIYMGQKKKLYLFIILFSGSLNICSIKSPTTASHEFRPQGQLTKIVSKDDEDWIYFTDGRCKRRLVNGFWWERCSPKRKSTNKKTI